jgi:hypothetical protein
MSYLGMTLPSRSRHGAGREPEGSLMHQATLNLEILTAQPTVTRHADAFERTGFELGWDHAHHGLVPPPGLLLPDTPIYQGWMAGKAVFGGRALVASRAVRQWLALRLQGWRQGVSFEGQQVTAHYLGQIHSERCPVLRQPLGGAANTPLAGEVSRLNPQAGYAAGNLATLSHQAAHALADVDVSEAVRRARRAELDGAAVDGMDAAAWWRLATLRAFATPLPFFEAARLPLALLPPNRVRVLNAAQGLQVLVTLQFATPGWSARARALGAMLPAHTLRHDFNLFVAALAPRVLEAGHDAQALRRALEDAWLNERVQRRWQHFVLSLGEAGTESLLERAAEAGLAGVRLVNHAPQQAIDGWGLPANAPNCTSPGRLAGHGSGRAVPPGAADRAKLRPLPTRLPASRLQPVDRSPVPHK